VKPASNKVRTPKLSPCGRLKVARKVIRIARKAIDGGDCGAATALMAMCFGELAAASRDVHRRFQQGKGGCSPGLKTAEEALEGLSTALAACRVRKD
jgi:hypothetical protein